MRVRHHWFIVISPKHTVTDYVDTMQQPSFSKALATCLLYLILGSSTVLAQDANIDNIGYVEDGVRHVNAEQAADIINKDPAVRVLDVRTGLEYRFGHIKGAENINYYGFSFEKKLSELDKNVTWLVHCKVGVRSSKTLPLMKEAGLTHIIHLDGGIDAWKEAGLPVTRE